MTLLDTLRAATSESHRRLEGRLPLLDADLSRARYRHVLAAMWGYHAPLEARLDAAGAWRSVGLEGADRRRAPRLRSDLLALGLSEGDIDRLPRCVELPQVATPSDALGCLYVVEGSTLGGQVILRHLARHLGVHAGQGASFFAGYGSETGMRWKETCAAIAAFDASGGGSAEGAARAAVATFASLEAWLAARGVLA